MRYLMQAVRERGAVAFFFRPQVVRGAAAGEEHGAHARLRRRSNGGALCSKR